MRLGPRCRPGGGDAMNQFSASNIRDFSHTICKVMNIMEIFNDFVNYFGLFIYF